jgi:RNA polymerase sigma factor (sigma-70 family)
MEVSALTHPSAMPGLRGPSALLRLQSDERLISLTRRGQPAAFETLCARYQSRLLSFCRHMLSSREDAEDVLQEVFAAAFNAVLADEREINVRPWLYRIARNRSLNHLRRTSAIGVDSMDVHFSENGLSTSDKVLRRESFRELIGDVHELPETQRTALLLREIDALSYDQIAQAMETTVPSVKSLLVRARISLAEAAEARKLSCEEVRLELGEVAEGLVKLSTSARRHVRGCERCASFKKHLRENNRALAAIMPVAPLLLLKKLLLTKLGSTASAGGAHAAGAGATVGATVGAGAAASGGGASIAGGLMTAGAGALATKAVAGLAAAAIVTAGAVAADHAVVVHHHHRAPAASASTNVPVDHYASAPVVIRERAQPSTPGLSAVRPVSTLAAHPHAHPALKVKASTLAAAAVPAVTPPASPGTSAPAALASPAKPTDPQSAVQVTEVTTETTQLPSTATTVTPTNTTPTPTPTPASPTTTPTAPTVTTPVPPSPPATGTVTATEAPAVQAPSPSVSAPPVLAEPPPRPSTARPPTTWHRPDTGGTEAPSPQHLPTGAWWSGRRAARTR